MPVDAEGLNIKETLRSLALMKDEAGNLRAMAVVLVDPTQSRVVPLGIPGLLKQDVTAVTLVNNTVGTTDITIPAGKRWMVLTVKTTNMDDVARVIFFYVYKEAAKTNMICELVEASVTATAKLHWPNNLSNHSDIMVLPPNPGLILAAGNVISVVYNAGGASSGGTGTIIVTYLEYDV